MTRRTLKNGLHILQRRPNWLSLYKLILFERQFFTFQKKFTAACPLYFISSWKQTSLIPPTWEYNLQKTPASVLCTNRKLAEGIPRLTLLHYIHCNSRELRNIRGMLYVHNFDKRGPSVRYSSPGFLLKSDLYG
jgi:hypothetical protein